MQEKLFALCGLDEVTKELIHTYCQDSISIRELRKWCTSVEFESLSPDLTCMAAAAGSVVRFADVPEMMIPRLRGIIKYVHTLNSGMVSGVCLLGAVCNQAQIQVLLLEETALYMRYSDAPQRHLWQMYVGVPTEQYEQVLNLARENGFTVECYPNTAVARQGVTRQIIIRPVEENSYLWNGAEKLKKGNAVFLYPKAATMLIEAQQRTFRALTKPKPRISLVRWSMDMKILLQHLSDEDWILAKEIAQNEHVQYHMRFLFSVYTAVTGIKLEKAELFGAERNVKRILRLLQAYTACAEAGRKLRRTFLLYRLRRPDSLVATIVLLIRLLWRKFKS